MDQQQTNDNSRIGDCNPNANFYVVNLGNGNGFGQPQPPAEQHQQQHQRPTLGCPTLIDLLQPSNCPPFDQRQQQPQSISICSPPLSLDHGFFEGSSLSENCSQTGGTRKNSMDSNQSAQSSNGDNQNQWHMSPAFPYCWQLMQQQQLLENTIVGAPKWWPYGQPIIRYVHEEEEENGKGGGDHQGQRQQRKGKNGNWGMRSAKNHNFGHQQQQQKNVLQMPPSITTAATNNYGHLQQQQAPKSVLPLIGSTSTNGSGQMQKQQQGEGRGINHDQHRQQWPMLPFGLMAQNQQFTNGGMMMAPSQHQIVQQNNSQQQEFPLQKLQSAFGSIEMPVHAQQLLLPPQQQPTAQQQWSAVQPQFGISNLHSIAPPSNKSNMQSLIPSNEQENEQPSSFPTKNREMLEYIKRITQSPIIDFLCEMLNNQAQFGHICSFVVEREFRIHNTKTFMELMNLRGRQKPKSYLQIASALKSFENRLIDGKVLMRKVKDKRNQFKFFPDSLP